MAPAQHGGLDLLVNNANWWGPCVLALDNHLLACCSWGDPRRWSEPADGDPGVQRCRAGDLAEEKEPI